MSNIVHTVFGFVCFFIQSSAVDQRIHKKFFDGIRVEDQVYDWFMNADNSGLYSKLGTNDDQRYWWNNDGSTERAIMDNDETCSVKLDTKFITNVDDIKNFNITVSTVDQVEAYFACEFGCCDFQCCGMSAGLMAVGVVASILGPCICFFGCSCMCGLMFLNCFFRDRLPPVLRMRSRRHRRNINLFPTRSMPVHDNSQRDAAWYMNEQHSNNVIVLDRTGRVIQRY